jgi:hypothetical protein
VWERDFDVEGSGRQIGVRVSGLADRNSADDTGGVAVGDWLVEIQGIKCSRFILRAHFLPIKSYFLQKHLSTSRLKAR